MCEAVVVCSTMAVQKDLSENQNEVKAGQMYGSTEEKMPSVPSSSSLPDSGTKQQPYSRKEKSLGLLCTNFISLYDREDVKSIGLDDASKKLGVERRRIYDIVNVLESVGVITKRGKNEYTWIGFDGIPKALHELKEEGLRENNLCIYSNTNFARVSDDDSIASTSQENSNPSCLFPKPPSFGNIDSRREKSLGLLTQNFVKLFLCTNATVVTLDQVARILLGDSYNSVQTRNNSPAKVRRLYDIANVLSSINLIVKTHKLDSRKPAFRWLGYSGTSTNNSSDSKKRLFGVDITNTQFKRTKVASSINQNPIPNSKVIKCENLNYEIDCNRMPQPQESKERSKGVAFGPFSPTKVSVTEKNNSEKVQDWENLASSHRPIYRNQALNELFAHYVEAWKSWYVEIVGKQPVKQVS